MICSDMPENKFITGDNATLFRSGDQRLPRREIVYVWVIRIIDERQANRGRTDILTRFNWDAVAEKYLELFNSKK